MSRLSDKMLRRLIWLLLSLALIFLGVAFYIPAKAMLAQVLLRQAWSNTLLHHGQINKPWPWADTWPVARLIVPSQDVDQIILHDNAGNSQVFEPVRTVQSYQYKHINVITLNANHGNQFHFLEDVVIGEIIDLQNMQGQYQRYQVQNFHIIDMHNNSARTLQPGRWLIMIAGYPFSETSAGSSQRYVVTAQAVGNPTNSLYTL